MPKTAQMVATVGESATTHAIRGEYRYDRTDNRTMCNRPTAGVQHMQSGAEINVTCKVCQESGPRWIVYMHVDELPGSNTFDIARVENGREAKEALSAFAKEHNAAAVGASLYPYSPEDWESAVEFRHAGCPFDYPSKLIEQGARGGFRIEQC